MHPGAVVFAVLAAMSIQGSANLQTQWNIVGEFSNLPQEELIEWIKYSTKPGKKKVLLFSCGFPYGFIYKCATFNLVTSSGFNLSKKPCFSII